MEPSADADPSNRSPVAYLPVFHRRSARLLQRNNASAARTKGLEEDLGLQGRQMDTLLSILCVPGLALTPNSICAHWACLGSFALTHKPMCRYVGYILMRTWILSTCRAEKAD